MKRPIKFNRKKEIKISYRKMEDEGRRKRITLNTPTGFGN